MASNAIGGAAPLQVENSRCEQLRIKVEGSPVSEA